MTKTYLGYGYTNSRGVARLQYNPNDELLEKSGYKNNNNYDTQVSASFTHQSKEYESNKKYYEGTPIPSSCLYYNDGTRTTDFQLPSGVTCTTNGEYLTFSNCAYVPIKFPVQLNGDWECTFDIKAQTSHLDFMLGSILWGNSNTYNENTTIKLVFEGGTIKQYANGAFDAIVPIGSISNYQLGIRPQTQSLSIGNIRIKRLE